MSGPSDVRAALVARALELRDAGDDAWLEQACTSRPDLAVEVVAAVAEADGLTDIFSEGAAVDRRVGTVVAARYELLRRLGAGAMGVVYEAEDTELGRRVAVKVLRPGLGDQGRALARFEREARAMAAVDHPAVIAIHDLGRTGDGETFLVMDLVQGVPLWELIERLVAGEGDPTALTAEAVAQHGVAVGEESSYVRVCARWVADLAAGLAVTHAAGVVHRDVKPSNVIVRADGRPVLLDFGVAHLVGDAPLTRGGTSVGTPAYMPPEALGKERSTSPAGDVYGLTAVLYCLLTHRAPYGGTPVEVMAALAAREPGPAARLHPGLARDLGAIVEKGMARKPSRRYADAAALEADLRAFLAHRPVVARPIGPLRRAARRLARSKVAWGALAALLVVATLGLVKDVHAQRLADRSARWTELWRRLPPNLGLIRDDKRVFVHEEDRCQVEALLDRMAELCVDPLPTHLHRACFRLDHGDVTGAAADMALVARHEGTPLAAALAAVYAAAPEGAAGWRAVDLSGLPEPVTSRDRYLRAYHHARTFEEDAQVLALLDDEVVAAVPYAVELRWYANPYGAVAPVERHRLAAEQHAATERYEELLGVTTATTLHFKGAALAHMNQYDAGLQACEGSVALAPRTHVNRTNAGWCALNLGRHDLAREHLRLALEVCPGDDKAAANLVWTEVADGRHDDALGAIETYAPALRSSSWWTAFYCASVEAYRALAIWSSLDPGGAADSTGLAGALARARGHLAGAKNTHAAHLVDALEDGSRAEVFHALAEECAREPRRLWRLRLVLAHFPTQLDEQETELMKQILDQLEGELTGALVTPFPNR